MTRYPSDTRLGITIPCVKKIEVMRWFGVANLEMEVLITIHQTTSLPQLFQTGYRDSHLDIDEALKIGEALIFFSVVVEHELTPRIISVCIEDNHDTRCSGIMTPVSDSLSLWMSPTQLSIKIDC